MKGETKVMSEMICRSEEEDNSAEGKRATETIGPMRDAGKAFLGPYSDIIRTKLSKIICGVWFVQKHFVQRITVEN